MGKIPLENTQWFIAGGCRIQVPAYGLEAAPPFVIYSAGDCETFYLWNAYCEIYITFLG